MQEKILPVMTVALIGAAFAVGLLYGKVSVYESGGGNPDAPQAQAGNQAQGGNQPPAAPEVTELDESMWDRVVADAAAAVGEEDAPVTMVEFTDYQCPFCARYFEDTYGQVMENYVETGQVRYLTRDLPLSFHQNAEDAALAARCAGDQDAYMAMHDALFENQDGWSNASDPQEQFVSYAQELGLNTGSFTSCYENGTYTEAIQEDLALAREVGATGTPTFFINGTKLVGAQPYTAFEAEIEDALAQ